MAFNTICVSKRNVRHFKGQRAAGLSERGCQLAAPLLHHPIHVLNYNKKQTFMVQADPPLMPHQSANMQTLNCKSAMVKAGF